MQPTALNVEAHPEYATPAQLAVANDIKLIRAKKVIRWAKMPARIFTEWERYQFKFYHKARFARELDLYMQATAERVKTGSEKGREKAKKGLSARKWAQLTGYDIKRMYKIFRYLSPSKVQIDAAIKHYEEVNKPKYASCRYCQWSEVEKKRGGRKKQGIIHLETCPSKPINLVYDA